MGRRNIAKIEDYELGKEATQDEIDFKDRVREVWNNGKYQGNFLTTVPPTYSANRGEFCFGLSAGRIVLYVSYSDTTLTTSSWLNLASAAT